MLSVSERLNTISHPLIASIHMRKDFSNHRYGQDVLVIETVFSKEGEDEEIFDSYLVDLLTDLEELKKKVESYVGSFDRVDIRTH